MKERPNSPVDAVPAAIEEELWFGGHDASVAEDAAARSMAALVGRIVGAKPFPESARKLAELTRKDVIRIEPIVQVLERDPALSARLLRLVNSAGYALRQRCTSVRHAATLVGTDRLHQIATTAAVLDLFDARGTIAARIVEHSTIVGAFCRYFGAHLALPVDDLFTAGFLHDIGKLMLLETEGDQYVELLEKYADRPDAIHVVERSLYGFDHAVLGAHVLTAWNIPDPVPKIVAWHHDPTRAYRISSMMAALVQTVRLADLAVYAMVGGAEQEQFSTLASTEAASYLDISEPQLSSMWEELQTLYRESVEQCRGENAPALDPRSLRPKQPLNVSVHPEAPRSTELPLQFPCVVCGRPTFGNTCSACNGHMCPEHQEGREDWCTLCARDFRVVSEEAPQPMSLRLAIVVAFATVAISVAFGYETGGLPGAIRASVGTILLILLAALLAVTTRRLLLRFRFVRNRPNRALREAQENDGGMLSIAPPFSDPLQVNPAAHRGSVRRNNYA
ncbi:MAG: HDOD domain-containing protein [Polyangiaceae bacterium]